MPCVAWVWRAALANAALDAYAGVSYNTCDASCTQHVPFGNPCLPPAPPVHCVMPAGRGAGCRGDVRHLRGALPVEVGGSAGSPAGDERRGAG
jgi:hypothetical protein